MPGLKGDNSDKFGKEDRKYSSENILSAELFSYVWYIRVNLDQELSTLTGFNGQPKLWVILGLISLKLGIYLYLQRWKSGKYLELPSFWY